MNNTPIRTDIYVSTPGQDEKHIAVNHNFRRTNRLLLERTHWGDSVADAGACGTTGADGEPWVGCTVADDADGVFEGVVLVSAGAGEGAGSEPLPPRRATAGPGT